MPPGRAGHKVIGERQHDTEATRRWVIRMEKISVEVRSGMARFAVGVQANTIRQALDTVATRFSGNAVRVKSPIFREGSSAEASAA
jgi:hypothetical protein